MVYDPPLLHPTSAAITDPAPQEGWEGLVATKRLQPLPGKPRKQLKQEPPSKLFVEEIG